MSAKIDHVNSAYSQIRISGLTVNPSPENITTALTRLEDMMAELEGRTICIGYNFEPTPDPNTASGVPKEHKHMVDTNLAVRLIPDFNKEVPQILLNQASQSFSNSSGIIAAQKVRQVQAPSSMPRGSGNRIDRWSRFNTPEETASVDCSTHNMLVGEIDDFTESFVSYLDAETIASYTITATSGLTIASDSNTDDTVLYRISAVTAGVETVTITITTSSGRVKARTITFGIT